MARVTKPPTTLASLREYVRLTGKAAWAAGVTFISGVLWGVHFFVAPLLSATDQKFLAGVIPDWVPPTIFIVGLATLPFFAFHGSRVQAFEQEATLQASIDRLDDSRYAAHVSHLHEFLDRGKDALYGYHPSHGRILGPGTIDLGDPELALLTPHFAEAAAFIGEWQLTNSSYAQATEALRDAARDKAVELDCYRTDDGFGGLLQHVGTGSVGVADVQYFPTPPDYPGTDSPLCARSPLRTYALWLEADPKKRTARLREISACVDNSATSPQALDFQKWQAVFDDLRPRAYAAMVVARADYKPAGICDGCRNLGVATR
jgi:hypothetical protein